MTFWILYLCLNIDAQCKVLHTYDTQAACATVASELTKGRNRASCLGMKF